MVSGKDLLVFDMDGVLVEVTESYREAIVQTVEHFTGKRIERSLIQDYKNQGGWNNDWSLSQKIASDLGVEIPYQTVVDYFNKIFFGENNDGLIMREVWIGREGLLERLARRFQLAVFTGRLRFEARITLDRFTPHLKFDPLIGADDVVKGKPDPEGLLKIAAAHAGREMWYVGDTVDDARSSAAAGVPFIGIVSAANPTRESLTKLMEEIGAAAVLEDINQLESVLCP